MTTKSTVWYVIVRKDNGYPLVIYADKERAEWVANANGERLVPVVPQTSLATNSEIHLQVQVLELRHLLEISKGDPILEPQLRDRLQEAEKALEVEVKE